MKPDKLDSATILYCADQVDAMAEHFVGNQRADGSRDYMIYEQGIGCERAAQMLRKLNELTQGTMPVPYEITECALKLDRWFKEQGVNDWAYMGVRSR
jgi:hypothetical protein